MNAFVYDVEKPLSLQDVHMMNRFLTPEYQIKPEEIVPKSDMPQPRHNKAIRTEAPPSPAPPLPTVYPAVVVELNDDQKRALTKRACQAHVLSWDTPIDVSRMELHNLSPYRDALVQPMSTYLGRLVDTKALSESTEVYNGCLAFANMFVHDAVSLERLASMVHYTCFYRPHARTSVKARGPRARIVREFINPLTNSPLLSEASASTVAPRLVSPPPYLIHAYMLKKSGQPYVILPRLTIPSCLDEGQLLAVAGSSAHFVGSFGDEQAHAKCFVVLSQPDGTLSPLFLSDKQTRTYMCLIHGRYQKKLPPTPPPPPQQPRHPRVQRLRGVGQSER